jgi:hypothetical protein
MPAYQSGCAISLSSAPAIGLNRALGLQDPPDADSYRVSLGGDPVDYKPFNGERSDPSQAIVARSFFNSGLRELPKRLGGIGRSV